MKMKITLAVLTLVMAGCSSTSTVNSTNAPAQPKPAVVEVEDSSSDTAPPAAVPSTQPTTQAPSRNNAVSELLTQARLQYRYSQFNEAVRTAERGLRIERGESEWYLILAESYLQLGSPGNAQQFARQGLRYSNPVGSHYQRLKEISDTRY